MPTVTRRAGRKTTAKSKPVARKTVKTTAKAKPAPKRVAKAKPVARASGQTVAQAVAKAVPAIVKKLKAGTTMTEIRATYGPGPIIREALWNAGYNTKGEKIEVPKINGSGAVLAKRIAAARADRRSWTWLKVATGMTENDMKDLLDAHGYQDVLEGRVLKDEDEAPRARSSKVTKAPAKRVARKAKATVAKAKPRAAAKAKPARPARKVAAKTTTGKRPGRRVRRVNPSSAA